MSFKVQALVRFAVLSCFIFVGSRGLSDPIPAAVRKSSESVFRIIFLRPKAELAQIPAKVYEDEIEKWFSETSVAGWWLREVGKKCRAEKKGICPLMMDLRLTSDKKILLPIGSTALVGNRRTLFTAPHVWVAAHEFAVALGQSGAPAAEITKKARNTFIGREIDFVLLDEQRNVVLNTYETRPAKIRDYSVGTLFGFLYPQIKVGVTTDYMEFMTMELADELPAKYAPIPRSEGILDAGNRNGLVKEFSEGAKLYSVGLPGDPKFNLETAKVGTVYHDLYISEGKLTRRLFENFEASPFIEKKIVAEMETLYVASDSKCYHGMSGGPILDEKGQFFSIHSTSQPVLPVGVVIDPTKTPQEVLIGPHPRILP
jgi:hypothetical protein